MASKAFGPQGAARPHLSKGEIADLRGDTEAAMLLLESKAGYPQVDKITGGGSVSLAAVPVNKVLTGSGFTQGQVAATLTQGTGTASLAYTANRPGTPGNSITVAIVQGVGALSVAAVGNAITVTLAVGGSTATAVKAAWDAVAAVARLAQVAVSGGGGGTVLVATATALAGGVGLGVEVLANGLAQGINGLVTDTSIPLVVTDLTGSANLDSVSVLVKSNGRRTNNLSINVVT